MITLKIIGYLQKKYEKIEKSSLPQEYHKKKTLLILMWHIMILYDLVFHLSHLLWFLM